MRPLQQGDFDKVFAVASDPLIWEQHPNKDRYLRPVFEKWFTDAMASGGALVAYEIASGNAFGSSRYCGYVPEQSQIEIGWSFLARSHWGGVYNFEMKQLMLDHAFEFVDCVHFVIDSNNIRSQKGTAKIGATYLESQPGRAGGTDVVYELPKARWLERRGLKSHL